MLIKHFTPHAKRVMDPLRPGRTGVMQEWRPTGGNQAGDGELRYDDPVTGEEVVAKPDEHGWYTVPHEVGLRLCKFRSPGGFFTPAEVDEEVGLGSMEPVPPPKAAASKKAAS
jgi:hypothetical protein